jgi:hypothetical protein
MLEKHYFIAMKSALIILLSILFLLNITISAQSPKEFAEVWDKNHLSKMPPSTVRHQDLQKYLENLKKSGLPVVEVGRSYQDREIYQVEWGKGKLKVWREQVEVPNVVNRNEDQAIAALEERGLQVDVRPEETSSAGEVGRVIRQDPSGGTVDRGSTVVIVVGVAPATTTTTTAPDEDGG